MKIKSELIIIMVYNNKDISEFKMKVGFLFPNSEVSRNLAARLLESNIEVEFFCPDKLDVEVAQNIIFEMNILGRELGNTECRFREVIKKIKKNRLYILLISLCEK